jgi:membrane protease YdiL (CAAX protease family)
MLSEKPWKVDSAVRLLRALFAGFFLGLLMVQGYRSQLGDNTASARLILFSLGVLSFHGVGLALVHVFVREQGTSWREAFGFNAPRLGRAIFLAVLVAIMVMPIALSLLQLSTHLLGRLHVEVKPQEPVRVMQEARSIPELALYGIAAVVIAPLVEEIIFRGVLYPALKQSGYRQLALWGTSILFAFIHFNLPAFLPLTVLAVILTFLYETTNNLIAPIITHSLFNCANYAFLIWQKVQHSGI